METTVPPDAPAGAAKDAPKTPPLPLAGLRVIDVGNFLAGPYAASILGEFGAEVIKVEHPDGGDPMRRFGTATKRNNATLAWLSEARNRKSVTIDLLKPEGVELFKRLIAKSDVLVENFRPGTMESWGLGWPQVHEANPGIVMLRVSGYGQTGPYRRRSGFAHIAQAFGGLNYLAGFPGETPVLPGTVPLGDYIASLFGTIGVMVALRHKEQSGKGQLVDVGIYEAVFRVLEEIAPAYAMFGRIREREGAGSFVAVPHGHFRTQDNRWIAIACTTDKMFERLSVAMGRPELSSKEMYGARDRQPARDRLGRLAAAARGAQPLPLRGSAGRRGQQHRRHLQRPALRRARQPGALARGEHRRGRGARRRADVVGHARAHHQPRPAPGQRQRRGAAHPARPGRRRDRDAARAQCSVNAGARP